MFTLLSPAALWSLAALALPLLLHLWRRSPRTIRLPSLRFLQAQTGRRLPDLRWRELPLLLVRLALLATLACLLALPRWQHSPPNGPQRWILLDPLAGSIEVSNRRLLALKAAGYEPHLLERGLPVLTWPRLKNPDALPPDLWSLLREADASIPAGSTLAIVTPARLFSLQGIRPTLHSKVEWIDTPDLAGTTPHVWLASVMPAISSTSKPLVTIGNSDASNLRFTDTPPDGWKLETRPDAARLLGANGISTAWKSVADFSSPSVLILHDPARSEDARYLAAAVRTAVQSGGRALDFHTISTDADFVAAPAADWTFWLSSKSLPASVENRRTRLFTEAPAPDAFIQSVIIPQPGTPGSAAFTTPVRLWRRGIPADGVPLWTDASGEPLLTFTESANGPRWHFAGRFHPDWTDLPRTSAFPAWLQCLLFGDLQSPTQHDFRLADITQAQPSASAETDLLPTLPPPSVDARDLHWPLWGLAALFFFLERLLSHRRSPVYVQAPPARPEPVPAR